jgi:hypothetical protein
MNAALAGTERPPSWYRSSGPFSPDTFSSLLRLACYFSTFHRFTTRSSSWLASHATSTGGGGFPDRGFSGGGGSW